MERFLRHPRTLAIAQYTGYTLFFLTALVLCVPWTFPTRQLRTFVARQARMQGFPIKMDDIKLRGLGSVQIEGLRLTLPAKPGEALEGGGTGPGLPEVELKIDKISAKVAVLPLLFGKTVDLRFDIDAGNGSIADGHVVQRGEVFDVDIGKIADVSLGAMGVGPRALGPQTMLLGDLDAKVNGKAQVHYGGSTDDLTGAVELELADAILKSPELSVMGGFKLSDLGVGTLTLKVKMNLKQNIAALAAQRGAEKATVIHIETLQAEGNELELFTEETAHILIPPGKGGFKQASINLHFAFQFPDKPPAKKKDDKAEAKAGDKEGAKDGEADKPVDDRAKWTKLMTLAGAKLRPFERGGFIGIGCTGPLLRPQCKPELPMVTTGTKGGAAHLEGPAGKPAEVPGGPQPGQPVNTAVPEPAPPPAPNVEFKPAVRADTPPVPEPPPAAVPTPPPAAAPAAEAPKAAEPGPGDGRGERPLPEGGRGERGAGREREEPKGEAGEGDHEASDKGEKDRGRPSGDDKPRGEKGEKGEEPKGESEE